MLIRNKAMLRFEAIGHSIGTSWDIKQAADKETRFNLFVEAG